MYFTDYKVNGTYFFDFFFKNLNLFLGFIFDCVLKLNQKAVQIVCRNNTLDLSVFKVSDEIKIQILGVIDVILTNVKTVVKEILKLSM